MGRGKRFITLILCFIMLTSLAGCHKETESVSPEYTETLQSSPSELLQTASPTAPPTPGPDQNTQEPQITELPSALPTEEGALQTESPSIPSASPPEKTPAPVEGKEQVIEQILSNMSLEEKVGQLFFCAFRRDNRGKVTVWSEELADTVQRYHLGGIVLFGENIDTEEQTKQLIADMRNSGDIPLLIGVDEEGGRVSRLNASGKLDVEKIPSAMEIGSTKDPDVAYQAGKTIGMELKELGIDIDFAPVADVATNPENSVIGDRSFSSDPTIAGEMVAAFIRGLHESDISATAKHFPGHGDTQEDSHIGAAVSKKTLEEMMEVEWIPFQRAIESGVEFVMAGHISTPNATSDGLPASLSYEMLTEQLRNRLGFEGIIITDSLGMGAVIGYDEDGCAALMALKAGSDMVMMPANLDEAFREVCDGVKAGELSMEELDAKVRKVLSLKYEKGYLS